jgi:hypothetical protein
MRSIKRLVVMLALSAAATPAFAGRTCEEKPPTPQTVSSALNLALKVKTSLDNAGAQVALVGRVGRDMSEHGLRYSHVGIALREEESGKWMVLHELNQCGTHQSDLFDEGLGNFFLDDMFAYDALLAIPSPEVQQKLLQTARSVMVRQVHQPHYSLIAQAFSTKYQNSNQWVLELLAAAMAPEGTVRDRLTAQGWLQQAQYQPSAIRISQTKRLGAKLFAANIYFDDHSSEEWIAARYQTVTVESVVAFLAAQDKHMGQQVVK